MRTEADVMDSMKEHFGGVSDPRVPGRTLYPLMEVLVMAFVGVLCGGDDWEEIAAIAEEHESWLRRFRRQERRVKPLEQATTSNQQPRTINMKLTILTALLGFGMSAASLAAEPFPVRRARKQTPWSNLLPRLRRGVNGYNRV